MSYLPPKILFRRHDHPGITPHQALKMAELAMKEGRYYDAERLVEIVYERLDSKTPSNPIRH